MPAYKKNLTLSLGLISTQVDLDTVAPRSRSGLSRLCPEHHVKLNQKYECQGTSEAESHDVAWGSWVMGLEVADGWKVVNEEERPRVEGMSGLTLVPVPRKDLEANTFEGEAIYYASPSNDLAAPEWAVLAKLIDKGKVAFVAKGALRSGTGTEKIWRLSTFNGYLVLREVRFPESIKPAPGTPDVKIDRESLAMAEALVDKMSKEWDEFDSTDTMAARMAEWMEHGTDIEKSDGKPQPAGLDLKAALAAALED